MTYSNRRHRKVSQICKHGFSACIVIIRPKWSSNNCLITRTYLKTLATINNDKFEPTCYGKHDSHQGQPALLSISLEIINDVVGIERSEYANIIFAYVVYADDADEKKPNSDTWGKHVRHLLSTKPLYTKECATKIAMEIRTT